jgi:hypothetical protein
MLISTKLLKAAGLVVTVTEHYPEYEIEIYTRDGHPLPNEVHDAIENEVGPEYSGALIESLMQKIETIQLSELINKTGRQAWRDRHNQKPVSIPTDPPRNSKK